MERSHLWRWVASVAAVLVLGALGILLLLVWLFSEDIGDPSDLSASLAIPASELGTGERTLLVAVNQDAATPPGAGPFTVELSTFTPVPEAGSRFDLRLETEQGEIISAEAGPGTPSSRSLRTSVEPCHPASPCLVSFGLLVDGVAALAPGTDVHITATIRYDSDRWPDGAGLLLALLEDDAIVATSHGTGDLWPAPVLLTSDAPVVDQQLIAEVPRSSVPARQIDPAGTIDLTWVGGLLQPLPATTGTHVEMVITAPADRHEIEILDPEHRFGSHQVEFELPFTADCSRERCVATFDVAYRLVDGPWAIVVWSNQIPGLRTRTDPTSVRGWSLRERSD